MAGLTPSLSTGGMPRPHAGSVGTSVSSILKTKMPTLKSGGMSKGVSIKGVTMPKSLSSKGGIKLSTKTLGGTAVKAPKSSVKASSISSALKSLVSKASKTPALGGSLGMGLSSAIGAPAKTPSPAFFGTPNAGPSGIGLGM